MTAERLRADLDVNGSALKQYWRWLGNVFTVDLGMLIKFNEPVLSLIGDHIMPTLTVAVLSAVVSSCSPSRSSPG